MREMTSFLIDTTIGDYQVTTLITGGKWKENCYLLHHVTTGESVLIDPGEDDQQISAVVQKWGGALRYILLTHGHHDHVGAVAPLARKFGVAARVHRDDVRLLHHAPMYAKVFANRKIEMPIPYLVLDDQPDMQLGGRKVEVIPTPGLTSGSVCYVTCGMVFTGDTILFQHVGRNDLPGADPQQLKTSIDHLMQRLPAETIILPGHGRPWSMGEAQKWWRTASLSLPQYFEPKAQRTILDVEAT
jgi:glyoxylase-like metal-dependent hydrolase (beta-lactamase superfamily II)